MCGIVGAAGVRLEHTTLPRLLACSGTAVRMTRVQSGLTIQSSWVIDADCDRSVCCWPTAYGNADDSLCLVYNGEVYNYRELRTQLCQRGHRFTSHTDTEVILHLYEEKHAAAFQDLNGMFALALYDRKRQKLFLVRDRLGSNPCTTTRARDNLFLARKSRRFLLPASTRQSSTARRCTIT